MSRASARPSAALARVLVLATVPLACAREPPPGPPPTEGPDPSASAATTAAPRRPAKRWFMTRTPARCEVYSVEGEALSPAEAAPCPRYLEIGERIRLAGKTCMREGSADPARLVPVVCPDPLTAAEEGDRQGSR